MTPETPQMYPTSRVICDELMDLFWVIPSASSYRSRPAVCHFPSLSCLVCVFLFGLFPCCISSHYSWLLFCFLYWVHTVFDHDAISCPLQRIQTSISGTLKNTGSSFISMKPQQWCSRGDAAGGSGSKMHSSLRRFILVQRLPLHSATSGGTLQWPVNYMEVQITCGIPCRQRSKLSPLWQLPGSNSAQKEFKLLCTVW